MLYFSSYGGKQIHTTIIGCMFCGGKKNYMV